MESFLKKVMEFLLSFKFWGPIIYISIGYLLNSILSNLVIKLIKVNKRKNHKKQILLLNYLIVYLNILL